MSKPVRLPDYLHAEVEQLAQAEKRSTANMVQVLLEQALRAAVPETIEVQGYVAGQPVGPRTRMPNPARNTNVPDQHFKPDFK